MRVFKDVDIISALRKIVNNNNLFYKSDFEYDADTLKAAGEGKRFLWMSRNSGTWLFDERAVHIKNTEAYNTWQYYTDTQYYGVKAFAVEVKENEGGRPVGDIYKLHYNKDRERIARNSFVARTVDITFKPTAWHERATRTFDVVEYHDNIRSITGRYGEMESVSFNLNAEDDARLAEVLADFKRLCEKEATYANINAYVREMVQERFHDYGYKQNDMVFTTVEDACGALKHYIPVHILYPDGTSEPAKDKKQIDDALYAGRMFGMSERDKQLLNFFKAGNTLANLPFSHDELKTIFFMAIDMGKEHIEDKQKKEDIDNIIRVLDTALFVIDSHDEITHERSREPDDGIEQ